MEKGVELIPAITEAFKYKKRNPLAAEDEILKHILKFARQESKGTKIGMISTASKTIQLLERNPRLTEKEVIGEVVKEIPDILLKIDKE